MVNKLSRRVETFAAMAEKAGSICLGVEIEEEGAIHNGKTAMEDIKTILELSCKREQVFVTEQLPMDDMSSCI